MKIAYIVGPYRSKWFLVRLINIIRSRKVAAKYWKDGYVVICPHSNSAFFDKHCKGEVFVEGYLKLIPFMDLIVVLKGWLKSSGSIKEVSLSRKLEKEIIFL
jgi:hypothetical protein